MGLAAMGNNPQHFTEEELKALHALANRGKQLLDLERNYSFYSRLGRLCWKLGVTIGATVAAVAAFKDQLLSLFKWG